jgi:histidyl-tRNA synthetase
MDVLVDGKATIRLSHRGIFNQFLKSLGAEGQSVPVLRAVDKLAKVGADEVRRLLADSIDAAGADKILTFIGAEGDFLEVLSTLESLSGGQGEGSLRLRELHDLAVELGVAHRFVLDPSITRGLDYYTGVVYETFLDDLPALGSVMSGGRYNNLAALYTKQELPGVGASVGLDRLLAGLEELGILQGRPGRSDVLVLATPGSGAAQKLAQALRAAGLNAEVSLVDKKIAQQYKYAEAKAIRFVAQAGEAGAQYKDTVTGESLPPLSPQAFADRVKSL